ncbi:MAG: hypothetical protein C0505_06550 [Leptothrix sp. (in: Bacteria)]|nr:hypothetical protein [Leptothrix sp. (in: b-proteobacteria)]
MEAFFSWVGTALGALLVVAVLVAWREHLVRQTRPQPLPESPPQRAVSVDVRLDTQAGGLYESDAVARRATLDHTMGRVGRAARAGSTGGADAWTETSPMVLQPDAASALPAKPATDVAAKPRADATVPPKTRV